jgi:hypothetical protein
MALKTAFFGQPTANKSSGKAQGKRVRLDLLLL